MASSSEARQWRKQLIREGFEVRLCGSGHFAVYLHGKRLITFAASPSDHRSMANARARLRRALRDMHPR